ncbi:MAG: DNA-binding transcriptional regulator [Verrucomicrobia bacterium]|nr:DNA-binding transcriptional regulator [Verrucomicrobiota bacterium]
MPASKRPQIALLVDTATDWGRRIIRGIARYAQERGGWHLWLEQRCQHAPGRLPPGWRGEGIIARVADRSLARHLSASGSIVVNVSAARIPGVNFPTVTADLAVAARLAVEHLLNQGFRNFGYFAPLGLSYVEDHYESFVQTLAKAGHSCSLLAARRGSSPHAKWRERQKDLQRWLQSLPKPVAVLTWTSERGREVLHACRELGLLVPEQVAVLGGDEDVLLCQTSNPPLSAVALTSERIGYEAAALLDRLLKGARPPAERILIEPTRVVVRQSTDTLAINDRHIAQAIGFIRNHAAEPIQVSDILRVAAMSRSSLERRFQQTLGRSPAEEIRRVRLERAKQLLADTDMPVPDVADASGFQSREYLAYAFKRVTKMTPREYRARVRS